MGQALANQWGRDIQSAKPEPRRFPLLPLLLGLIIGAGSTFAFTDYLRNDPAAQKELVDARATVSDLRQEVASLQRLLEEARAKSLSTSQSAEQILDLQKANETVQQSLDAMQTEVTALQADKAALKSQLQARTGSETQDGNAAIVRANQLEEANRQLATDFLELQDKSSATITDLNAKILGLGEDLQNAKAVNLALEAAQKQTAATATTADARAKALNDTIAQLEDTLAATRKDLEETKTKLQDAIAAQAASQKPAAENAGPAPATVTKSRNPELVSQSLATATGAQALTPDQRSDLALRLVQGDCVGESLKATMGRVPVLLLRDLIRDLNSDC